MPWTLRAIAAHLVLGLVEPQSSGIGGGGFLLVFERSSGAITNMMVEKRQVCCAIGYVYVRWRGNAIH